MIPFCDLKPQYLALKQSIHSRIEKVMEHGLFVNGPEVTELEKQLAEFVGVPYALTCASGTDALLIPLMALGIGPGDEVITTSFSFIATAEVIALVGATPIFVDIDPDTYNLDLNQVRKAISPKTKAIMPVSLYGQMPDMEALEAIAKEHRVYLIEDAAQSFGATWKGRRSCSYGTVSGTSFFPAKPLGCYGDGGAIFTRDEKLYKMMREIREHGSERRYYHTRLGINGRLDTIQCAVLLAKMERYPSEITMRQQVAERYTSLLKQAGVCEIKLPMVCAEAQSVWAQYTIEIPQRDKIQTLMQEQGIPTSVHYPTIMPEQPWYQAQYAKIQRMNFPVAKQASERVLSLPFSPDLSAEVQEQVVHALQVAWNKL
ncbi:MAG: DegT/DnrJ/EryC1/StrS family aminotransferase [Bdellovibrionaceae bacterium]|jgi:UDP-2-acetamido-2-deoxy-ribo-hexuluronate aminotransferase|nr:DegT/DnrJ/EryC1/StrS family aminotransferase [Pseudobdellovibrionaceae bacterium]